MVQQLGKCRTTGERAAPTEEEAVQSFYRKRTFKLMCGCFVWKRCFLCFLRPQQLTLTSCSSLLHLPLCVCLSCETFHLNNDRFSSFPSEPTEVRDSLDDSLRFPLCIVTVLGAPGKRSKVMDDPEPPEDWRQSEETQDEGGRLSVQVELYK